MTLHWHWKQAIILNVAPEDLRSGLIKFGFKHFSSFKYLDGTRCLVFIFFLEALLTSLSNCHVFLSALGCSLINHRLKLLSKLQTL